MVELEFVVTKTFRKVIQHPLGVDLHQRPNHCRFQQFPAAAGAFERGDLIQNIDHFLTGHRFQTAHQTLHLGALLLLRGKFLPVDRAVFIPGFDGYRRPASLREGDLIPQSGVPRLHGGEELVFGSRPDACDDQGNDGRNP